MPEWVVGFHAVVAALEHEAARVELVLVQQGGGGSRTDRVLDLVRRAGVRWQAVPRARLDELSRDLAHNGFAARLAPAPLADADDLLALPAPVCLVCLDGVEDGHNLGAVIRTAAALSLGGVVVAGPHPPPLGGAAAKVAAGALPLIPVAHVGSLGDFARRARDAGFWAYGADREGEPVAAVDLPERLLLCLGAEASGLRAKTRAMLDGRLAIPIAAGVDSLNLAVATGILAWEWRRRHPA